MRTAYFKVGDMEKALDGQPEACLSSSCAVDGD
jgi:hypothetical protein